MGDPAILDVLQSIAQSSRGVYWNGLPDNQRQTYHEFSTNLKVGVANQYYFPEWARNYYVENLNHTDTAGTTGYLYVWYDWGENGTKQLPLQSPSLYESLITDGDFVSEHSRYRYLMVMPDSGGTTPEYVVKFTGRNADDFSVE